MGRKQERMQFQESSEITISWRKIFQVTLTLVLISFIFLIHTYVTIVLFRKIESNTEEINETQYDKFSLSSEWVPFWLFKIIYFTILLFWHLSTTAVLFTMAYIHTAKDVTFKKVMSVVPKVWKRLMVTFLRTVAAFFAFNIMTVPVVILWGLTTGILQQIRIILYMVILISHIKGTVALAIASQHASLMTVLEDNDAANAKVEELMNSKMVLILAFFIIHLYIFFSSMEDVAFILIRLLLKKVAVHGWRYGILYLLLLSSLFHLWLLLLTLFFYVSNSYHRENIDKSADSNPTYDMEEQALSVPKWKTEDQSAL